MLIFAYEQKIDDFFIPNGLPPKVIDKMYRMRNPKEVFNNGCYQEDSGLVLPVYQCDTYTNLLYLKNIDFILIFKMVFVVFLKSIILCQIVNLFSWYSNFI